MTRRAIISFALLFGWMTSGCNQPFEPEGSTAKKLVLYSILNSRSDTQYVRLSTSYHTLEEQEVHGARVEISLGGNRVQLRDTTIERVTWDGKRERMPVYVAYHLPLLPGNAYRLDAATPSGLSASATTTALAPPSFFIENANTLKWNATENTRLRITFGSQTGAFEVHFYVDFYAFVGNAWKLLRAEIPERAYTDAQGNEVPVYRSLSVVTSLTGQEGGAPVQFDTLQYNNVRRRILQQYTAAPVVWVQAVFVLTQVDEALYNYYYLNNGPADESTVRLDVPEFTNTAGGFGVFGSSATVIREYPLEE